jgi:hypothetical protein
MPNALQPSLINDNAGATTTGRSGNLLSGSVQMSKGGSIRVSAEDRRQTILGRQQWRHLVAVVRIIEDQQHPLAAYRREIDRPQLLRSPVGRW